jgi:hypothetical protein
MKNNLWFLTEERPKKEVLQTILQKFAKDYGFVAFVNPLHIQPILENNCFTFIYEVKGFDCKKVSHIYIKTISGNSSLVDYLIFHQEAEPTIKDIPIYAIEETKTDDKESRNTGVYQRCSKFVFIQSYYPNVKKIMLYNLQVIQKIEATDSYIFGTKMLKSLGVEILGKSGIENEKYEPFKSIDEFIDLKNSMGETKNGQSVKITKTNSKIEISAKMLNGGRLAHDPNIGMTTIMAQTLRNLGWKKSIEITKHQLPNQRSVGKTNKFIQIANKIGISLQGLVVPKAEMNNDYWKYDTDGEKLGTIFIHLVVENFTQGYSIFENHAGCEKGYFITKKGEHIPLEKYKDREKYKGGDKEQIVHIPDLILIDFGRSEVINVEGKKYAFRKNGIAELGNYDYIEKNYILKHYPKFKILRTVVLYGSTEEEIIEIEIGFLLNENGHLILGVKAPKLFKDAITNLLDFWN